MSMTKKCYFWDLSFSHPYSCAYNNRPCSCVNMNSLIKFSYTKDNKTENYCIFDREIETWDFIKFGTEEGIKI
jgi:hypothetical protein